jgi:predicted RNA binding protein YcfA (HicA-like mRNA interferase family)
LIRALERAGFYRERMQGDHVFMYNPETDRTATALDTPDTLSPGTIKSILREAGLFVEQFIALLK